MTPGTALAKHLFYIPPYPQFQRPAIARFTRPSPELEADSSYFIALPPTLFVDPSRTGSHVTTRNFSRARLYPGRPTLPKTQRSKTDPSLLVFRDRENHRLENSKSNIAFKRKGNVSPATPPPQPRIRHTRRTSITSLTLDGTLP